jgi:hypothetical protein
MTNATIGKSIAMITGVTRSVRNVRLGTTIGVRKRPDKMVHVMRDLRKPPGR